MGEASVDFEGNMNIDCGRERAEVGDDTALGVCLLAAAELIDDFPESGGESIDWDVNGLDCFIVDKVGKAVERRFWPVFPPAGL